MEARSYSKGKYAGQNTREMTVPGIFLSETVYKKNTISDWHYHENPYFALILNGGSTEVRKKNEIECLPGQAYFYNWDDVHRNKDYQIASRNFNVEFDKGWLADLGLDLRAARGSVTLGSPDLKLLLVQLFREYRMNDGSSALSVNSLAIQLISCLEKRGSLAKTPGWVGQIVSLLNDRWAENVSLQELASVVNIHPVTIAKYFPKHIGCSFGEYVRRKRIERSLTLIRSTRLSLTDIAHRCGFADQSHFIRTFKGLTRFLPNDFRRS